jgi:transposase
MDERWLESCIAEGLSLERIGRLADRHPSTVAYWLDKYGLSAPGREKHAARGAIAREELEVLVDSGASIAEIGERLGRSKATVRHWLGRYGLRTQNHAGRRMRKEARAALDAGVSELDMACPRHGRTMHRVDGRGYFRCLQCRAEAVSRRRRTAKAALVAEHGGRCALCGYDRSPGALQFHHLDPTLKEFAIAQRGHGRSLDSLRAEASKCLLLCSNCHAEVEHGTVSLSGELLRRG